MITVLGEAIRTARKDHQCSCCLQTIKRGERYKAQSCVEDCLYTYKSCERCTYIIDNHNDWLSDDEGRIEEGAMRNADFTKKEIEEIDNLCQDYLKK